LLCVTIPKVIVFASNPRVVCADTPEPTMSSKRRMVETMPRLDGYVVNNIIVASKRSARTYDTNAMILQGKTAHAPFWFVD
jgi:hypothetical protein